MQHFIITKIIRLTMFMDVIAVYCKNHTKAINTLWSKFTIIDC